MREALDHPGKNTDLFGLATRDLRHRCQFGLGFNAAGLPSRDRCRRSRARFQLELTRLAAAIEAYRLDQGRYPATLEELVPKYVNAIPPDMYGEAPLKYLATANGYELRSVGRDEKLEEAPEIGDDGTVYPDQLNDDLVIRAGEPVKMELPEREPSVPQ